MTLWTCSETTPSAAPIHDFDECMMVVQGLLFRGSSIRRTRTRREFPSRLDRTVLFRAAPFMAGSCGWNPHH